MVTMHNFSLNVTNDCYENGYTTLQTFPTYNTASFVLRTAEVWLTAKDAVDYSA